MPTPTVKLTIIKRFTYRGDATEEYSNSYVLTGSTPGSSSAWRALFDALVAQEKLLYDSTTSVVRGYGYNDVTPGANSVWSVDLTVSPNTPVPGTWSGVGVKLSSDTACWLRFGLDRLNSKGKRVFLRKYFHPAWGTSGTPDTTNSTYKTALETFGTKLRDGSFIDGRTITDHLGTAVLASTGGPYTTTRTLKRRGKRPPT